MYADPSFELLPGFARELVEMLREDAEADAGGRG
jgi:hypothetical protein